MRAKAPTARHNTHLHTLYALVCVCVCVVSGADVGVSREGCSLKTALMLLPLPHPPLAFSYTTPYFLSMSRHENHMPLLLRQCVCGVDRRVQTRVAICTSHSHTHRQSFFSVRLWKGVGVGVGKGSSEGKGGVSQVKVKPKFSTCHTPPFALPSYPSSLASV